MTKMIPMSRCDVGLRQAERAHVSDQRVAVLARLRAGAGHPTWSMAAGLLQQACPSCRYCAQDISQDIPGAAVIVVSPAYREQFESTAYPELVDRFLCWGMILEAAGDLARAAWANTFAAWHCDGEAARSTGCDHESAGSLMTEYRAFLLTWAVILRMATLGRLDRATGPSGDGITEVNSCAAELCRCAAVELFREVLDRGQAFAPEAVPRMRSWSTS